MDFDPYFTTSSVLLCSWASSFMYYDHTIFCFVVFPLVPPFVSLIAQHPIF